MSKFFKGRLHKGPKSTTGTPSQSMTPSTSTLTSTEHSDPPIEKIDWDLEIAVIAGNISEEIPLLAPLKAACALIARVLELAHVTTSTPLLPTQFLCF
jgi:hypothetical protein